MFGRRCKEHLHLQSTKVHLTARIHIYGISRRTSTFVSARYLGAISRKLVSVGRLFRVFPALAAGVASTLSSSTGKIIYILFFSSLFTVSKGFGLQYNAVCIRLISCSRLCKNLVRDRKTHTMSSVLNVACLHWPAQKIIPKEVQQTFSLLV